jgi:hypothetical protein
VYPGVWCTQGVVYHRGIPMECQRDTQGAWQSSLPAYLHAGTYDMQHHPLPGHIASNRYDNH